MPALAPGTRLGSYEILGSLGSGGMGEVYRARDARLGREIAIKALPLAVSSDRERLARFEAEARAVAALNHPAIVTIHSIEEAGGTRFLTMELIDGETLDRQVSASGLPPARVVEVAVALAGALVAAHDKGIVHRDLKPSNVMTTRDGRVKVLDFGLAKLAESLAAPVSSSGLDATQALTMQSPVSTAGQVLGTAPYMSPEQVRGEAVDARTDLFALGVILYELLAGRRPFAGASFAEVSSAILRDTAAPIERAEIPRDLRRIVDRCLEKDRDRRFQTARDVRNELELVRRELGLATATSSRALAAKPAPASTEQPSIAVLPFANRSADPADEYFSDGLADELVSVLGKIRGLRVAARTSSFQFKGGHEDLAAIGEKLHVATVVEGSVRKAGNRVRISVQLIKVADGFHLWSETYDRTLDDIFAVQDDIAQSVVKELRAALLGADPDSKASGEVRAEVAAAARGRGENAEAHRLYLQGCFFADRLTLQDLEAARNYLQRAVELDPGHALAWARLSRAYWASGGYGWLPLAEAVPLAKDAAKRAVALEPELADGHLASGWVSMFNDWNWEEARVSLARAAALAPDSPTVLRALGSLEHCCGRPELAIELFRRATDVDPLSADLWINLTHTARALDRLDEAREGARRALEIVPQRIVAHLILAFIASAEGRQEEALALAKKEPADWARLTALVVVHHAAGRPAESDAALKELIERHAGSSAYQIAAAHAARGEADEAFAWFDRCFAQRDSGITYVRCEPIFRPLHGDPRWQPMLERLGVA